jgi:predicted CoA-binding protein
MRAAILGASTDPAKFGNRAVHAYRRRGWQVIPVHPTATEVAGLACVRSLSEISDPLDRILVYLPPAVALPLLPQIAARAAGEVWFNPGSESLEIRQRATELGLPAVFGCAIVDIGEVP